MVFSLKAPKTNPEANPLSRYSITKKIEFVRNHFKKIESIFEKERKELIKSDLSEQERTKHHEDDSKYYYGYSESLQEIERVYQRMHRYSAVLTIYAYLEDVLNQICATKEKQCVISLSDLKGEGIVRAQTYLKKIVGVDFDNINSQWSDLSTLNQLRNCIMHGNGDPDLLKSKKLNKIINAEGSKFSKIEGKFIYFDSSYVYEILNTTESFLHYILCDKTV